MVNLMDIHSVVQEGLHNRFTLEPVKLKHPFPERPLRTLGLMKINGEVFPTDKLMRTVFIRPDVPICFAVRSTFIPPRVEPDLPVFAGEELEKTQSVFEDYLKNFIDNDPGVGIWKILFGGKGRIERSMGMHFGR